jgi:hypothetical protein
MRRVSVVVTFLVVFMSGVVAGLLLSRTKSSSTHYPLCTPSLEIQLVHPQIGVTI